MSWTEILSGLLLGVGLSAACGFRVFVPLLLVSVAGLTGWLPLSEGFRWLGTWPALMVLGVATVVEALAYQAPWLDHVLDVLAGPAAVAAGTLLTAAQLGTLDPLVKWSLALIAGGGAAGLVQGATSAARALSTLSTGGLANPFFAGGETVGAALTAGGTLLLPGFGLVVLVLVALGGVWLVRRRGRTPRAVPTLTGSGPDPKQGG